MWMACGFFFVPVVEVASGNTVGSGVLRVKSEIMLVKHYKYLGWTWRLVDLSASTFMEVSGLQSVCVQDIDTLHLHSHMR